jgi:DNA invertase Pin-like site-specific DNA recombinase
VGYKSLTEQYLDSVELFQEAIISILVTLTKQERIWLSERTKAGMARRRERVVLPGSNECTGKIFPGHSHQTSPCELFLPYA